MRTFIFFLFILLLFGSISPLLSEDNFGKVMGKVYDETNGSVLSDAVIRIETINKGTASDLDGKYELDDLKPGDYKLKVSYVGYSSKFVDVSVKLNEVTTTDLILKPESSTVDTVTVTAERTNNNEASLLMKQQKSDKISDGISEQQIKKSPDAVASEVLKRVIGVSIVNDKFVYVRGVSERYSNTILNGVQMPSTEPDKKAFTFDLFPSNLLENLIISKSFSPDLPGNFSGGLVEITTKDYPDAFTYNLNTTTTFLSNTTSLNNFLTYNAGQSKILFFNSGLDDGGRKLPSNFPDQTLISSNFTNDQLINFGKEFRNNWGQDKRKAPMNGGFQISIGNKLNVLKNPFGFFVAYTYRNSFSNKNVQLNGFDEVNNLTTSFRGQNSLYKVTWGAIVNLAYKIGDNNKISLKNSLVVNGEDATQYLDGYTQDFQKKLYSTSFKQRTLKAFQLSGDHYLSKLGGTRFSWIASYSDARRDEPDYKTMSYQRDPTSEDPTYYAGITTGSLSFDGGSRLFTKLFDINRLVKADFEVPAKFFKSFHAKLGIMANGTRRNFSARLFAPQYYNYTNIFVQQEIGRQSIDSIFNPANIRDSALYYSEFTRGSDSYIARDNLYASYLMFDALVNKFRIVAGARMEYYEQILDSRSDSYANNVGVHLKNIDILPAINVTYLLNDKINIRGSFYQTVSRPEFREIAPFGFIDFNTREFVVGNSTDLHRTLIRNYDLRFETFPKAGEIVSVSLFYKKIDAPIEEVFLLTSGNNQKTFQNASNGAVNYGLELEVRKNLGFLDEQFKYVSFSGNLSLISSKLNLQGSGSLAGDKERRMQGQSPYSLNMGLYYDNPNTGTGVNILFNKIGDRISEVGLGNLSDEKEAGRDVLDFTLSQRFLQKFEIKFAAKDLLNQDYKFYETNSGKDVTTRLYSGGINYSLSLSYKY